MLATQIGDPRLQALFVASQTAEKGVRPVVRLRGKVPPMLFVVVALVAATALFSVLNEKRIRRAERAIRTAAPDSSAKAWPAPPPIFIPGAETPEAPVVIQRPLIPVFALRAPVAHAPTNVPAQFPHAPPLQPTSEPPAAFMPPRPFAPVQAASAAPVLVDGGAMARPPFLPGARNPLELPSNGRVHASALANPSLTIPQGSLIHAVLETGFDSTKPGFARAVVSRDVRSFDGKNVLVPRGSRLVGESVASTSAGQPSASITWTRLIRPDGATIELDSPATDPAGRSGVPASVDRHFFGRVGDLIATTVGELGQLFAARASPLIVLSGTAPSTPKAISHQKRQPTFKAPPGTSIGVFVAHDLEFATPADRP